MMLPKQLQLLLLTQLDCRFMVQIRLELTNLLGRRVPRGAKLLHMLAQISNFTLLLLQGFLVIIQ